MVGAVVSYTVPELSARWQCTEETVRRMIRRGDLRAFRVGRQWRVTEEAVRWIECSQLQPQA
jgi:excisionase family DNA binding protein